MSARLDVRAVFLGMTNVDLERLLAHEGRNQWHRRLDADQLALLPDWISKWSDQVERECATVGIPYVDVSDDFHAAHQHAEHLLVGDL